jgi:hypothetical protein
MEGELISKKELLEQTGISYGQLYRWKRKNLVPEEWFIRKSTYTGQETFFPKDKILERINKIMSMKDEIPLDNLAEVFSPQLGSICLSQQQLIEKNIVTQTTLDIYKSISKECENFSFEKILSISLLDKLLRRGTATVDEGRMVLDSMEEDYKKLQDKRCEMLLIRKFGVSTCILAAAPYELYVEKSARIIEKVSITELIEELKIRLGGDL